VLSEEDMLVRAVAADPEYATARHALADWLEDRGATGGVTRLATHPSFSRPHVCTFVYARTQVMAYTVVGECQLWRPLPLPGFIDESDLLYVPNWMRAAADRCSAIRTWLQFRTLAGRAVSEKNESGLYVLDGVGYDVRLWERNEIHRAYWSNPEREWTPLRASLISLLGSQIALAGLTPEELEPYHRPTKPRTVEPTEDMAREWQTRGDTVQAAEEEREEGSRHRHSARRPRQRRAYQWSDE
jgi:uncharacterized protein (TIGR02996 family)